MTVLGLATAGYFGATRLEFEKDEPESVRALMKPKNRDIRKSSPETHLSSYIYAYYDTREPLIEGRLDLRKLLYGENPWKAHKEIDVIALGSCFTHPALASLEQDINPILDGAPGVNVWFTPQAKERYDRDPSFAKDLNQYIATPANAIKVMNPEQVRQISHGKFEALLPPEHFHKAPKGYLLDKLDPIYNVK